MFENFSPTNEPINEYAYLIEPETDVITIGADNVHEFCLPFPITESDFNLKIIYKQSISTILTIPLDGVTSGGSYCTTESFGSKSYIKVFISAADSKKFVNFRTCFVQLKFSIAAKTYYSDKYCVKIIDALDTDLEDVEGELTD